MLSRLFSEAELSAWAGDGSKTDSDAKGEAIIFASIKTKQKKTDAVQMRVIATGVNLKTDNC